MKQLTKIISENIGVQHALAEFLNAKFIPRPEYIVVMFPVIPDKDIPEDEFEKDLRACFEGVTKIETYDSRYFYRVSLPKPEAINEMVICAQQGLLNKWLQYFSVRDFEKDAAEKDSFKISAKEDAADMEGDEQWAEFIHYLKEGIMTNAGRYGLSIPGFTLEEVKADKYIKALANEFESVRAIIFEYEWEEKAVFYKTLELK